MGAFSGAEQAQGLLELVGGVYEDGLGVTGPPLPGSSGSPKPGGLAGAAGGPVGHALGQAGSADGATAALSLGRPCLAVIGPTCRSELCRLGGALAGGE